MLDSHPHPALAFGGFTVMDESPREHRLYPIMYQRDGVFCFAIRSMILKDLQPRLEKIDTLFLTLNCPSDLTPL